MLNRISTKKVEKILRLAIEKRLDEGWCLKPGRYYFDKNGISECCVLGALLLESPHYSNLDNLKRNLVDKLALPLARIGRIAWGFEYGEYACKDIIYDSKLYKLGARLRTDYCVE